MPGGSENLGAQITLGGEPVTELFSESQSRFLLTVKPEHQEEFEQLVEARLLGRVTADPVLVIEHAGAICLQVAVEELRRVWKGALPCLLS